MISGKLARNNSIKEVIWRVIRKQGEEILSREPQLFPLINESILKHSSFGEALVYRLSTKLSGKLLDTNFYVDTFTDSLEYSLAESLKHDSPDIERLAMEDMIGNLLLLFLVFLLL